MRAEERLAKALSDDRGPDEFDEWWTTPNGLAHRIIAADPHLAQDIEDGAALRRLREALPDDMGERYIKVTFSADYGTHVFASGVHWSAGYPTIAQAADACREAIEAQR